MKNLTILKNLIRQGESDQLEFKKTLNKQVIARVVCSFLNTKGGQILIGMNEDGSVTGIDNAEQKTDELMRYLNTSIVPESPVSVFVEPIDRKAVIHVKVWAGSKQPHIYNGTIYFRKGERTVKASSGEISNLIHNRQESEKLWERQQAFGVTLNDIDLNEVRTTMLEVEENGRGKLYDVDNPELFLEKHGLLNNGVPTNAAVVLFGKEPARFLPQIRVRLSVLPEGKTGDKILYDEYFEKNIFKNFDDIYGYIKAHFGTYSEFSDSSWQRQDRKYPLKALREGILNALVHRDYSNTSGSVMITFFSDRLEISNHGVLPENLKPSDLKRNHLSHPVNPDIAHICFLRGWIEKIGRGTLLMIKECKEAGFPEPRWKSSNGMTTLTFQGITVVKHGEGTNDGLGDGITEVVIDGINKGVIDGVIDGVSDGVSENLIQIIKVLYGNSGLNTLDIAERIGKSKPTTERYMKRLKDLNMVQFEGSNKAGGYVLNALFKEKIGI